MVFTYQYTETKRIIKCFLPTRCICPYGTSGPRCKVLSRHFEGKSSDVDKGGGRASDTGSWAWAPTLPACSEVHISLEILTFSQDSLLLYSGPQQGKHFPRKDTIPEPRSISNVTMEEKEHKNTSSTDGSLNGSDDPYKIASEVRAAKGRPTEVIALELRRGRPFLLLDLGSSAVTLALNASYSVADNTWHRIDVIWKDEVSADVTLGFLFESQCLTLRTCHVYTCLIGILTLSTITSPFPLSSSWLRW